MQKPINYFKTMHAPRLTMADDGFGNLVGVPDDAFWFNSDERKSDLESAAA